MDADREGEREGGNPCLVFLMSSVLTQGSLATDGVEAVSMAAAWEKMRRPSGGDIE